MTETLYFPFGQPLKRVVQKSRTPRKVFVLGVYASAVHAKWLYKNNKQVVAALAVASEPEIFWTGENAHEIISAIKIPRELGQLTNPDKKFNGPSGRALDEMILRPMGLTRNEVWLCDLLPESRVNANQRLAITNHYTADMIEDFDLLPATVPDFDKSELKSEARRIEIMMELEESQADTLILLGDLPLFHFLMHYTHGSNTKLSDFGDTEKTYGILHELTILDKKYQVIPLCHPRQMGRLGTSSLKWGKLHDAWIGTTARNLIGK